jgi:hypothetical protein
MCEYCELLKNPIQEYKTFSVCRRDSQLIAIWKYHQTTEQVRICHCWFSKVHRTLKIKARQEFGHNRLYIEKHEDTGHLYWTVRENPLKNT